MRTCAFLAVASVATAMACAFSPVAAAGPPPPPTGQRPPAIARPSKPSDRAVPAGYDGPVTLRGCRDCAGENPVTVYERSSSGRFCTVTWPPSDHSKLLYASPYRDPWMWIWNPENGLALAERRQLYRISDDMRHQGCFVQLLVGLVQRLAPNHRIDALSLEPF